VPPSVARVAAIAGIADIALDHRNRKNLVRRHLPQKARVVATGDSFPQRLPQPGHALAGQPQFVYRILPV
jgi:hypothetical protein